MEPALGWDPIGKPEGVALGVVADVGRITPYGEAAEYGEFSDRAARLSDRYEAAGPPCVRVGSESFAAHRFVHSKAFASKD
jgi:hypothetical protein